MITINKIANLIELSILNKGLFHSFHVLLAEYLVNMFVLQTITNESKSHLMFYKYLMLKLAKLYSIANFSIKYLYDAI